MLKRETINKKINKLHVDCIKIWILVISSLVAAFLYQFRTQNNAERCGTIIRAGITFFLQLGVVENCNVVTDDVL